jgi:hypothetical protein
VTAAEVIDAYVRQVERERDEARAALERACDEERARCADLADAVADEYDALHCGAMAVGARHVAKTLRARRPS